MLERERLKIDLGVMNSDSAEIDPFCRMGRSLDFSGLAVHSNLNRPEKTVEQMKIYRRVDIKGKSIGSIKKQIGQARNTSVILTLEIGAIDRTNWIVEDGRVDLLTINSSSEHSLRVTTARLASEAEIALEIQIAPLLHTSGLNRSKMLKTYREAIETAHDNDMMVVITSGTHIPMGLRSPVAMVHIGMLLGLDKSYAQKAIDDFPSVIVHRNLKKLDPSYVGKGVEIIKGSERA